MKKHALLASFLSLGLLIAGCQGPASSTPTSTKTAPSPATKATNTTTATPVSPTAYQADVVVIGAGGAGMASAILAKEQGASVVVLEKMDYAGGNTTRSEGGMNAAETKFQKAKGIKDTVAAMIADTMKGGKQKNDPVLVDFLARHSAETVHWLGTLHMDVSDVAQGAGASFPRMHRPAGGKKIGGVLVPTLLERLDALKIPVLYSAKVTNILGKEGAVTGVEVLYKGTPLTINAHAVILATGGFGANSEMVSKLRPDLKGFATTNHPGATGDGITLGQALGAAVLDLDQIQTNPTVEVKTQTVLSESVRGKGAILVNQDGQRFTSEMLTRDALSAAILKQPQKIAYLIFDQTIMDSMKALQENDKKGIIEKGSDAAALERSLKLPAGSLKKTLEGWNQSVAAKKDASFGRTTGMDQALAKAPYYAITVSPAVHYTMGGLKINDKTEVLNAQGAPILGLYAAGEVTGGVHGANRLGGNAIADILVFGRRSGQEAGAFIKTKTPLTQHLPEIAAPKIPKEKGSFKDGLYKGSAKGHQDTIQVAVKVQNGNITDIQILDQKETPAIFASVLREFIPNILEKQTTKVDLPTGATHSAKGVQEAVDHALKAAK
ncbi:Fumarate reductase flavoprotein subunit [Clostridiaceae bacterium JG1575]|nr:Fumarate reductase flavoprotein subunit [Clostridiaceae bacterium JG1575]